MQNVNWTYIARVGFPQPYQIWDWLHIIKGAYGECRKTGIVCPVACRPRLLSIRQWPNPFFFSSHVTRIWRFHTYAFVIVVRMYYSNADQQNFQHRLRWASLICVQLMFCTWIGLWQRREVSANLHFQTTRCMLWGKLAKVPHWLMFSCTCLGP